METTFNNVQITIEAADPKAAYDLLCQIFDSSVQANVLEYTTHTYSTSDCLNHSTTELFPNEEDYLNDPRQ